MAATAYRKAYMKNYWKRIGKEKKSQYAKTYYEKNSSKVRTSVGQFYKNNLPAIKLRRKKYHLKAKYQLSIEDYEKMLRDQGGKCAICPRRVNSSGVSLAVDHDHQTNKLRGILCFRCNMGLGYFADDITLLTAAVAYLKKYEHQ